ncbi:MAG: hypothetical protein GC189_06645 [Alphaproteobacteria bacterium]|nr:hypothetical protein [Alphaproteobacteria bacterium]
MRLFVAALAALLAVAAPAWAQAPEAPERLQDVYACAAVNDDAQRLACYDQAVGRLRVAQEQGDFAAISREEAREIERDGFGFSLPSIPRLLPRFGGEDNEAIETVSLTIDRLQQRGYRTAFYMSNGQVWVQTESTGVRGVRAGAQAEIRRAALGSYLMRVDGVSAAIRVRREE